MSKDLTNTKQKYIVIESFDHNQDHRAVTCMLAKVPFVNLVFLYVRRQKGKEVEFGDFLWRNPSADEWTLDRGPHLEYTLTIDDTPPYLWEKFVWDHLL